MHCLDHSHDVLWWHICQDIMYLLEDEPTSHIEDVYLVPDVPAHLIRSAVWQDLMRIAPTAPKDHLCAEVVLKAARLHPPAADLHGVKSF